MNKRYRRQMLLRSHRHRAGKLGACGCHEQRQVMVLASRYVFGNWMWYSRKWRSIQDLPDINAFQANLERFREAMVRLGPVVTQLNATIGRTMEMINAQPQGPES